MINEFKYFSIQLATNKFYAFEESFPVRFFTPEGWYVYRKWGIQACTPAECYYFAVRINKWQLSSQIVLIL